MPLPKKVNWRADSLGKKRKTIFTRGDTGDGGPAKGGKEKNGKKTRGPSLHAGRIMGGPSGTTNSEEKKKSHAAGQKKKKKNPN